MVYQIVPYRMLFVNFNRSLFQTLRKLSASEISISHHPLVSSNIAMGNAMKHPIHRSFAAIGNEVPAVWLPEGVICPMKHLYSSDGGYLDGPGIAGQLPIVLVIYDHLDRALRFGQDRCIRASTPRCHIRLVSMDGHGQWVKLTG